MMLIADEELNETSCASPDAAHRSQSSRPAKATRPLRVMFLQTSMPVGGAETLTANLVRSLDRQRFAPEIACLKHPGPLGEKLAREIPVHHGLLRHKFDARVLVKLARLFRDRKVDAIVTVGAGDKMFWGRLAARWARVPVVLAAIHSTGWPDSIGRLNRLLTPITDSFIAVAPSHGHFLIERLRLPAEKVAIIPNGVDTDRFSPLPCAASVRAELGIDPAAPVATIVAALRPEKNHEMFLSVARTVARRLPTARFLVVGDGPLREHLEQRAWELGIANQVSFLGSRDDVPRLLAASDVFTLTSHNEANPVSILEAMSTSRPVVATDVGSIHEAVDDGRTGYLVPRGDPKQFSNRLLRLLENPLLAREMGAIARQKVVNSASINVMVRGYEQLIESVYQHKTAAGASRTCALPPELATPPPASLQPAVEPILEAPPLG